jgi:8-oxo-dGTP diphosphatase
MSADVAELSRQDGGVGTRPEDPRPGFGDRSESARAAAADAAESVEVLWARVAREWGIDFEPPPPDVIDAVPELRRLVEHIVARLAQPQDRRWLAAALAALAHSVNAGALDSTDGSIGDDPGPGADPATDGAPGAGSMPAAMVAVAVVTGPRGVLVGRRRDGIPRWVFPGGRVESGETAAQAAVRECAEETGVAVIVVEEIGRRLHPATGRLVAYVACGPAVPDDHDDAEAAGVAASDELVEVLWLAPCDVEARMPDLFEPVREHLGMDQQR